MYRTGWRRGICLFLFGLFILQLCACEKQTSAPTTLWYQEREAEVCGVYTREGSAYTVTLTLGKTDSSGNRSVTLEYTQPAEMAGVIFCREGTVAVAKYDTTEIPLTGEAVADIFAPAALFELDQENITDIGSTNNGQTLIQLSNGEDSWEVYTDSEGAPLEIRADLGGVLYSFQISSFTLTERE